MAKKIEDYLGIDNERLLALIAFRVDDMCEEKFPEVNRHLKQLNNRVDKNDRSIIKLQAKAEVEKEYGLVKLPMNKKKMIAVGGGGIAIVLGIMYLLPEVINWIKTLL